MSKRPYQFSPREYLVVSDKNSKVLKSTQNYYEAVRLANIIRRGGGEVTIFRAIGGGIK